jgi:Ca-activated chloride channel homolog
MTLLARQALLAVISLVLAQNPLPQTDRQKPVSNDDEPIKLNATLVQVPVIVKGTGGRYVTDLKKEEFTVYENGVRQEVEFFGTVEEPFNVALLIDSSGSTLEQLQQIKAAAFAFIENLRPQDKVMLFEFNDSVQMLSDLTSDRDRLKSAVAQIKAGEYTQVYEAVYTAVWEKLADVEGRKAVIIFSDGIDTASSEISDEDTLDAVVESEDVIVYPIRYATRIDNERKMQMRFEALKASNSPKPKVSYEDAVRELDRKYRKADEYLFELARLSGGVVERADQISDLKAAFARIADELRRQYLLGYYPTSDKKIKDRRITVKVNRDDAVVRARPGYKIAQ